MKIIKLKYAIGFILSILLVSIVFASISSASKGSELLDIEEKILALKEDNTRLKDEILKHSSLKNVEEKASDIGFVEPAEVIFLNELAP